MAEKNGEIKKNNEDGSIEISEKIPANIIEKIPMVLKILEDFENVHKIEGKKISKNYFSGPLPPQVLENLTNEQKDKIIEDMVKSKERQYELQKNFIENITGDKKNSRLYNLIKIIFISLFVFGIYIFSVFTKTSALLKDFLPYIMMAFGGGGIALIYLKTKKENKDSEIVEDIIDDE